MKDIKKLTYTALLTAWAIIIPFVFGFMSVTIGPFTATLTAHVPMFLSMFLGPQAAVITGLGSALGFFITKGPIIGARALMHVFVGLIGAILLQKNVSFHKVAIFTALVHGILEALVVLGFVSVGAQVKYAGNLASFLVITVGVGTVLHHSADAAISWVLVKFLSKAGGSVIAKQNS
ncbi:ECF transporter S component [Clostridium sp. SYSU_GA19001]|uniref:ECF transporter S component n=1 Tax=Clostridium caldaquaticum TaxID=2940653 RepID=UPI002077779B|nr:ECF transporter S component [Clostridium caldaquaticum]MCM8711337.1 ECF transporter S component [Clostridium caldaquaticum]